SFWGLNSPLPTEVTCVERYVCSTFWRSVFLVKSMGRGRMAPQKSLLPARKTRTETVRGSRHRAFSMSLFVPLLEFNHHRRRGGFLDSIAVLSMEYRGDHFQSHALLALSRLRSP